MNPIRAIKKLEPVPSTSSIRPNVLLNPAIKYYKVSQVAEMINSSKRHVNTLIEKGELANVMDISSPTSRRQCLRIPSTSVDEYKNKNSAL